MEDMDDSMYMLFLVVYWSCVAWGLWFLGRGIWRYLKKLKDKRPPLGSAPSKDEGAK